MKNIPRIFMSLMLALTLFSCSSGWVKREVISKVVSPDGLVDALLYKTNAGATTSFGYEVYLVPHGNEPDFKSVSFRADHAKSLALEWKPDKILDIVYTEARIFHFMNFWQSKDVQNFAYVVELRLSPTRDGHSLSDNDRWVKNVNLNGKEVMPGLPDGLPE